MKETRGYVGSRYGQLHYREMGSGEPMLLLHQTAWSSVQFEGVMPLFADAGFRVIAADTPGYGMSDGPDEAPTVDDYASAMVPLIDELNLDNVLLVGHHTGASIAAALGVAIGGKARAVAMHAPPLYTAEERKSLLAHPHFDQTPRPDGSHLTERWQFARAALDNRATLEATNLSILLFFVTGQNEWHGHHAVFGYDLGSALSALKVPGLIMSNTGDISHKNTQRARDVRPDFEYAELDGGTVYITWEEPERWAPPIIEFAARH